MLCNRAQFGKDWLAVIDPIDRQWNYENHVNGLWIKHQIAHYVNPKVIVELGVRSGYAAWAMLKAVPDAHYFGYDNYDPGYAAACGKGLPAKFKAWALKLLKQFPNAEVIIQDVYEKGFVPPLADLYHIDADHSYEHAKKDLLNCVKAGGPDSVYVAHDFHYPVARIAILDAMRDCDLRLREIPEARNGDGVLMRGRIPDWVFALGKGQLKVWEGK